MIKKLLATRFGDSNAIKSMPLADGFLLTVEDDYFSEKEGTAPDVKRTALPLSSFLKENYFTTSGRRLALEFRKPILVAETPLRQKSLRITLGKFLSNTNVQRELSNKITKQSPFEVRLNKRVLKVYSKKNKSGGSASGGIYFAKFTDENDAVMDLVIKEGSFDNMDYELEQYVNLTRSLKQSKSELDDLDQATRNFVFHYEDVIPLQRTHSRRQEFQSNPKSGLLISERMDTMNCLPKDCRENPELMIDVAFQIMMSLVQCKNCERIDMDVKPDNFVFKIIDGVINIKRIDFGLVFESSADRTDHSVPAAGTIPYMHPGIRRARNHYMKISSLDKYRVYSWAVTMIEILDGRSICDAESEFMGSINSRSSDENVNYYRRLFNLRLKSLTRKFEAMKQSNSDSPSMIPLLKLIKMCLSIDKEKVLDVKTCSHALKLLRHGESMDVFLESSRKVKGNGAPTLSGPPKLIRKTGVEVLNKLFKHEPSERMPCRKNPFRLQPSEGNRLPPIMENGDRQSAFDGEGAHLDEGSTASKSQKVSSEELPFRMSI